MRPVLRFARWLLARLYLAFLWGVRSVTAPLRRRRKIYLHLMLDGGLPDFPPRLTWLSRFRDDRDISLYEALDALKLAREDAAVAGLVLSIRDLNAPWASLWELREALLAFKAAGKDVRAFADGLDMGSFWLASAANHVTLVPQGGLQITGMRAEVLLLRSVLDRLGVKAEFLRAGKYKSYAEMFTETQMSPEAEEALGLILDDRLDLWVEGVASARKLEPEAVRRLLDEGPFRAEDALARGLIDRLAYGDEIQTALEEEVKQGGKTLVLMPMERYHRLKTRLINLRRPLTGVGHVVVLEVEGNIVEGEDRGLRRPTSVISRESYQGLLRELGEDDEVAGVVLRVDSPGGSALVSDILWREVKKLGEAKPVWVSMGSTAASGGYYISAPAARIYASPMAITGSIGVIAGKFQGGNLLSRVGVSAGLVERGSRAGMYGVERGFSDDERAHLQADVDAMYAAFLSRVAEGRKMETEAVHEVAQGRIWSGAAARERGLVDRLGGMRDAIDGLVAEVGQAFRRVEVHPVPAPTNVGLPALLGMGLRGMIAAELRSLVGGAPHLLGDLDLARDTWGALSAPGRRLLALMPFQIRG